LTLKAISGTDRPDRRPKNDPAERLSTAPRAPKSLGQRATAIWRELSPVAVSLGTLRAADLAGFRLLCETLATAAEATETVATEGLTIETANGQRKHPCVAVMETARAQARTLLAEFGLTPKGRQGVDAAPATTVNEDNPYTNIRRLRGEL
jgi:P27 family predicted phage terminase small subunit